MAEKFIETALLKDAKEGFLRATVGQNAAEILASARTLLTLSPTLGTAQQILNKTPLDLPGRPATRLRVAFLRSFTIEPVIPLLRAHARLYGVDLTIRTGDFNSYAQEILDPTSWLYEFNADLIVLSTLTRDAAPELWSAAPDLASGEAAAAAGKEIASRLTGLLGPLRLRTNASVVIQNLEQPSNPAAGILDARREGGQADMIQDVNRRLRRDALEHKDVYVLDYDALIARHGRLHWNDENKWLASRSPIAADCLTFVAQEYLRYVLPMAGRQAKVIAVDLDNTLWGGVIGEDGVNGIQIGSDYPGANYLALQRVILDLANRGVLLAVCSKNNPADALEALEKRPEMLLRPRHFVALRINWADKAQNLREIAHELNVGLDSIAFLDDNPAERQRVMLDLPQVYVIDLPADPSRYATALQGSPVFERLNLTAEDLERGRYYAEQRGRSLAASEAGSLEDYYRSLEMKAEIIGVTSTTVGRIAQLTQKTNQLNMTTKRYTESEIQALQDDPAWTIFGIRISDKFGDNGLVGVVILEFDAEVVDIDTFLLSCRVIGRTVETAMLSHICKLALAHGCTRVTGRFSPTAKNSPAANIYPSHGFRENMAFTGEGASWELNVSEHKIATPEWIGYV